MPDESGAVPESSQEQTDAETMPRRSKPPEQRRLAPVSLTTQELKKFLFEK